MEHIYIYILQKLQDILFGYFFLAHPVYIRIKYGDDHTKIKLFLQQFVLTALKVAGSITSSAKSGCFFKEIDNIYNLYLVDTYSALTKSNRARKNTISVYVTIMSVCIHLNFI